MVDAWEKTDLKKRLERYHGNNIDGVFKRWRKIWLADTILFMEHNGSYLATSSVLFWCFKGKMISAAFRNKCFP